MQAATTLQLHMEPETRAASLCAALLPPLALLAALMAALRALFAAPFSPPAVLAGAAAVLLCALLPKRLAAAAEGVLAACAALAFALSPALREGALALLNRLYGSSEAVNAYAYEHFAASDAALASALPVAAAALGTLCAFAARRRAALVALLLAVAALEAYFGVTPGLWRNILLFAVLGALLVFRGREAGSAAALLVGVAAAALAVFLLAPRPNAAVEAYSEHLRDELGRAAMTLTRPLPRQEDAANRARAESRQREEASRADDAREDTAQAFEHRTRNEREISLPRRFDWLRTLLLLLAAAALLLAPFLPFLLLNRAQRRTLARRAAFASADNAAAIRAMFAHTMDWLRAGGLRTENLPYAQCAAAVEALTSPEYAARYASAAPIWEEAAYSDHAITGEQRRVVRELLDTTAATIYGKANRRTKLRMKYVDCLCGS